MKPNQPMNALLVGLVLAGLVFVPPPAAAGTQQSPEIVDPVDDAYPMGPTCPIPGQSGFTCLGPDFLWPSVDMLFAWVSENDTHFQFHIQMKASGSISPGAGPTGGAQGQSTANPSAQYDYSFSMTLAGVTYLATEKVAMGATPGTVAITPGGVATSASVVGNITLLNVPKTKVGSPAAGTVMSGLFATAKGSLQGQTQTADRAPDANSGRPYTTQFDTSTPPPPPQPPVFQTISDKDAYINATLSSPTTQSYTYNWTSAPGKADLQFRSDVASGEAYINVTDAAGKTVFSQRAHSQASFQQELAGGNGTWKIVVEYRQFQGNLSLAFTPASGTLPSSPTPLPTSSSAAPTTSASAPPSSSGSEAPTDSAGAAASTQPGNGTPAPATLATACALFIGALVAGRRRHP